MNSKPFTPVSFTIKTPAHLAEGASEFVEAMQGHRVFAFDGAMGAGKTTLTAAVCRALGVEGDDTASPTFAIHNEYLTAGGESIHHFDLYRLSDTAEALDAGLEEYLDNGDLCFIEWPEVAEPLLPDDTIKVTIAEHADGSRLVTLSPYF
ncbi:MAG: tRNA (adenosine(37)-N6)-threonylcarbamoyltransferase complex ATPase subunit type 1 TsaE [Candidatus Amulumruptor caecigallinarius]|nr:tRNA (adenosine(37)-N6)-threonylcarbamoyltransferase complex ATPase subunit type 1 TsaE [Candidatus Amulumruptor caecigallinarius]MCM1397225.1 tRNA (adenosine(37)-N6)-threonylcarbamoyltransferase complex ATPase subunit type 1 TsaE [Candidatus Amulumruptor caecigallinarius]MCM1454778.1 tRNA (adenosine(37)-N6)-threonylcarbamoyltransferase complex ATPase subunit type 1 TsaE [bacterium]